MCVSLELLCRGNLTSPEVYIQSSTSSRCLLLGFSCVCFRPSLGATPYKFFSPLNWGEIALFSSCHFIFFFFFFTLWGHMPQWPSCGGQRATRIMWVWGTARRSPGLAGRASAFWTVLRILSSSRSVTEWELVLSVDYIICRLLGHASHVP